jgi:hypothetical protein
LEISSGKGPVIEHEGAKKFSSLERSPISGGKGPENKLIPM